MIEANGPGDVSLGEGDRAAAVAAVKAALELRLDDHDGLIAALAETALGLAEQFLGQLMIARTVAVTLPVKTGWQRLPLAPVTAIGAATGVNAAAVEAPLAVGAYEIDIVRGEGWVRLHQVGDAVRVRVPVTAGIAADWGAIPAPIAQGAVMLAAYLFSERDTTRPPPGAITALWRPFRALSLAEAARS